jgi:hypothetical protein
MNSCMSAPTAGPTSHTIMVLPYAEAAGGREGGREGGATKHKQTVTHPHRTHYMSYYLEPAVYPYPQPWVTNVWKGVRGHGAVKEREKREGWEEAGGRGGVCVWKGSESLQVAGGFGRTGTGHVQLFPTTHSMAPSAAQAVVGSSRSRMGRDRLAGVTPNCSPRIVTTVGTVVLQFMGLTSVMTGACSRARASTHTAVPGAHTAVQGAHKQHTRPDAHQADTTVGGTNRTTGGTATAAHPHEQDT